LKRKTPVSPAGAAEAMARRWQGVVRDGNRVLRCLFEAAENPCLDEAMRAACAELAECLAYMLASVPRSPGRARRDAATTMH